MWNYFTIQWLCEILKDKLTNYKIAEIFTQNKNEIIFGFYSENKEEFYWVLNFDTSFPYMRFSDQYSRAKRNSLDLFADLPHLSILEIKMHQGERSFHFELEKNIQLIFKLHGGRSNVIVKSENSTLLFRTNLKKDLEFVIPKQKSFVIPKSSIQEKNELKQLFPILDKISISFLEKKNFYQLNSEEQKELLNTLLSKLNRRKIFLYQLNGHWTLHQIQIGLNSKEYLDLLSAINDYSSLEGKSRYISVHKSKILKELKDKSGKLNKSIQRMDSRLNSLINNNDWEENANLIMANLHLFKDDLKEIEVFDFYNDRNKKIKIKKGLSAQKYAETLYRKTKNKGIEINQLRQSISRNSEELEKNKSKINEFQSLNQAKEIKEWLNKEKPKNTLSNPEHESRFKEFNINGFEIFVGKNSKNNDLLTTKFAKKDDLWMHAKDVSGSHLIIKKDRNTKIPTDVLEKAASIAAWYSKGKNDTLFPVIYTDKKYVRKGKGMPSGQVFVDKYDVIIVKPELP